MEGISITFDMYKNFPTEVKDAINDLDKWWGQNSKNLRREDMPKAISKAFKLIKETPLPGYKAKTGADTIYVNLIEKSFIN